nr:hypothetical protein [Tanacetum cinerariifolium]
MVLSLEQIKTNQAAEIEKLKKRVKKLEGKKKRRTHGLKRLYKVGLTARVESFMEQEGLGDQEDAFKPERIAEIDADEDLSLINETAQDQGMMNDEDLFGVNDLDGDEVIVDVTTGENVEQDATVAEKEVSAAADEVVTTAESVEDKGKGIMVEHEKPLKKKDQIAFDEEVARKLDAQMKAKIKEEERIAKEKDKANIDLIEEWDDVQATIDADSFDAIKKMFDKVYKGVNTFVAMDSEVIKGSKKTQTEVTEDSSKRARYEIEQESAKRQRLEKEDDTAELKRCLKIVPEDDDDKQHPYLLNLLP